MAKDSFQNSSGSFKTRAVLYLIIVPAVFFLDYFTKQQVQQSMVPYGDTITVIENYIKLRFIFNEGIVFGLNHHLLSRWLLIVVQSVVAAVLSGYIFFSKYRDVWGLASMCLIVGGALGNLLDRALYGRVVDFIEIGIKDLTWPVFNVADIAITCGAILLAIRLLFQKQDPASEGIQ